MNGRIIAIMVREWEEACKNGLLLVTAGIPATSFAFLPALMLLPLKGQLGPLDPVPAQTAREAFGQFLTFFSMLPVIIPSTIASYSIIGEKQSRSLESLLATPIRTSELLMGKALAYVIPSVALTWLAYALSIAAINFIVGPRFVGVVWQPSIAAALVLLAPMLATLSMLLMILVSARSRDPREAQQWTVFLIVPLAGIGIAVGTGHMDFSIPVMAAVAAGMAVVNALVLRLVTAMFQREVILTRWK